MTGYSQQEQTVRKEYSKRPDESLKIKTKHAQGRVGVNLKCYEQTLNAPM